MRYFPAWRYTRPMKACVIFTTPFKYHVETDTILCCLWWQAMQKSNCLATCDVSYHLWVCLQLIQIEPATATARMYLHNAIHIVEIVVQFIKMDATISLWQRHAQVFTQLTVVWSTLSFDTKSELSLIPLFTFGSLPPLSVQNYYNF